MVKAKAALWLALWPVVWLVGRALYLWMLVLLAATPMVRRLDLRTERRRATWWARCNLCAFAATARIPMPSCVRWRVEHAGRACLRRSIVLHHRRAARAVAVSKQQIRERALPPVLRPSESRPRA